MYINSANLMIPVNSSNTFFNYALDILEELWIFVIHPVCNFSSIIKNLSGKQKESKYQSPHLLCTDSLGCSSQFFTFLLTD